jgi:hypothetical protein
MIFKGHLNRLDRMLDGDMTRASAWMAAMIEHLEAYTAGAPPVLPEPEQDSDDLSPRRRGRTVLDDELKEQGDEHEPAIGQDETPESDA